MNAVLEAREPNAPYLAMLEPSLHGQFDLIAQAPNGVARLRELILTLAVQGKLVPQDPNDEPASALLERIRAEKARLVKEGKIRKDKPLTEISEEEKPFALPASWEWVRLGAVAKKITDGTHHSPLNTANGDFKYISAKNIKPWGIDLSNVTYVTREVHEEIYARCDPEFGDVLYIKDGATTGVVTVNPLAEPFSMLSSVALLKPSCGLHSDYLALVMASPIFYQEMRAGMTGVAITRVTLAKLINAVLPLPPLPEQSRIVARVEELMALCDALEAKGKLEAEQHARLVGSLFESLANSESTHALAENWQRIATHFDLLLDRPAAVDALEQTILQLAVRGLLVPQDPTDESASALLQTIQAEKDRLIATGQLKRDKPLPPISDEEKLFELPEGWEWVRCGEYFQELCTGPFGSVIHKEDYVSDGVPLINPSHMIDGEIIPDFDVSVPTDMALRLSAYRLSAGDVVLARRGEMGRFALVTEREDGWLCGTGSFFAKLHVECNRRYLALQLLDPRFRQHLLGQSVGSTMVNMNQRTLLETLVAIPPLAEQSRIVARVAELRTLCAQLRERLVATVQTQSRLAATLTEKACA